MARIITEKEFSDTIQDTFINSDYDFVTGIGRSGAIASVYISHKFDIPFLPFKQMVADKKIIVVDTIINTGKTLRLLSFMILITCLGIKKGIIFGTKYITK